MINKETSKVTYTTVADVKAPYAIPFEYMDSPSTTRPELAVTLNGESLSYGKDYTLSTEGLTLVKTPAAGETLIIERDISLTQEQDYQVGYIDPEQVEVGFDRSVMRDQMLADRISDNETAIKELDERVTANEGAIEALDGRVTANEGAIAELKTDVKEAHDLAVDASVQAASAVQTATDAANAANAADKKADAAVAAAGVAGDKADSAIAIASGFESRIAKNESDIGTITSEMSVIKQDQMDLGDLVHVIESKIPGDASAENQLATKGDVAAEGEKYLPLTGGNVTGNIYASGVVSASALATANATGVSIIQPYKDVDGKKVLSVSGVDFMGLQSETRLPTTDSSTKFATTAWVQDVVSGVSGAVDSVNGKTGAVVLSGDDIEATVGGTTQSITGFLGDGVVHGKVSMSIDGQDVYEVMRLDLQGTQDGVYFFIAADPYVINNSDVYIVSVTVFNHELIKLRGSMVVTGLSYKNLGNQVPIHYKVEDGVLRIGLTHPSAFSDVHDIECWYCPKIFTLGDGSGMSSGTLHEEPSILYSDLALKQSFIQSMCLDFVQGNSIQDPFLYAIPGFFKFVNDIRMPTDGICLVMSFGDQYSDITTRPLSFLCSSKQNGKLYYYQGPAAECTRDAWQELGSASGDYVEKNQGTENAGKFLKVGADGQVVASAESAGGGLTAVAHDDTLAGAGTDADPLRVVGGGVSGDYLPLSGGTLTGPLNLEFDGLGGKQTVELKGAWHGAMGGNRLIVGGALTADNIDTQGFYTGGSNYDNYLMLPKKSGTLATLDDIQGGGSGADDNGLEGDYCSRYGIVDETQSGLPTIVSGKTIKIPAGLVMDIPGVPGLTINSSDITFEIPVDEDCEVFLANGEPIAATHIFFSETEKSNGESGYDAWWNGTEWKFKSNDTGNVYRAANAVRIAKCVFTDGSLTRLCFTGCRLLNKQEFAPLGNPESANTSYAVPYYFDGKRGNVRFTGIVDGSNFFNPTIYGDTFICGMGYVAKMFNTPVGDGNKGATMADIPSSDGFLTKENPSATGVLTVATTLPSSGAQPMLNLTNSKDESKIKFLYNELEKNALMFIGGSWFTGYQFTTTYLAPCRTDSYTCGNAEYKWASVYTAKLNNGADIVVPSKAGTLALLSDITAPELVVDASMTGNGTTESPLGVSQKIQNDIDTASAHIAELDADKANKSEIYTKTEVDTAVAGAVTEAMSETQSLLDTKFQVVDALPANPDATTFYFVKKAS